MRFHLKSDLMHWLFEEKFGGIDNFADAWANSTKKGSDQPTARSVKTIYKWLAQGLPKNEETFFSFFGVLGVDPFSLIDLDKSQFRKHFGVLRQAVLLGGINIGGFRPLLHVLKPSPQWPGSTLVKHHYGRDWTTRDLAHEAEETKNLDVTLRIEGRGDYPTAWPRAYHIAYRRLSNADGLWRPFGTVITRNSEAILVHENGSMKRIEMPYRSKHQVAFKTFFGPSPADFRIASLHPFEIELELYDDPEVVLQFAG